MRRGLVFSIVLAIGCGKGAETSAIDAAPSASATVAVPAPPAISAVASAKPDAGGAAPKGASVAETYLRNRTNKDRCQPDDVYGVNGGQTTFWCYRPAGLELADVAKLAGVPIYSVPATTTDFGHYNPAFVKWVVETAGPSPHDSEARALTQPAFDAHLRPLARSFHYALAKARAEPDCFNREKAAYAAAIAKKDTQGYYYRWFYFMNPAFCDVSKNGGDDSIYGDNGFDAGLNGNVIKTVVGFWLRRSMDGTMDEFAEGLNKLLASYEPDLVQHAYRPPSKTIQSLVDKGVVKAQACKGTDKQTINVDVQVPITGTFSATAKVFGRSRSDVTRPKNADCVEQAFAGQVPAFDGGTMTYERTLKFN